MRTKFKQWAVDYLAEHPEIVIEKFDFSNPFFNKKLNIEIGSGKGDFISSLSLKRKDESFVGVERVRTIAGIMAKKIVDLKIENVRVFPNDFQLAVDSIPDESFDTIYLNFVDPWPKKRHEKRRLTYPKFLEQYYRILRKNGRILFKSDNDGLYEYSVEQFETSKFKIISKEFDYQSDLENDAMTEYETKFRARNQKIHRIIVEK